MGIQFAPFLPKTVNLTVILPDLPSTEIALKFQLFNYPQSTLVKPAPDS
jgi:hypothetical protein